MRKQALQQILCQARYDALLLTSETARRYATGFASSAGVVYLSDKTAVYYTDFRYAEAARAAIKEFEVREIPSGMSYTKVVNQHIDADGVKTIALEDDTLTYAAYTNWATALHATVVRLEDDVHKLRVCKSKDEVACIVAAQRMAERAFAQILGEIRVGVTEKEIAARLTYLMLHEGAENMSFDPIVVSGKNSSMPHGVPSEKPIEEGDFVTMDFGCIYEGYCSDMTRTVAVGHATDKMHEVYHTVLHVQERAQVACRAGITGQELDTVARTYITEAGYGQAFGHGLGHGVGLAIHEAPTISQRGTEPLRAGMVITNEPGIYLPGQFGVRIEDMLLVEPEGCTNLTHAPKELVILP